MRTLILTEGGQSVGFGHMSRCKALSQAFGEKGISSEFIVHADENGVAFLQDTAYRVSNWTQKLDQLFDDLANVDFILIDSYLADEALYYEIAGATKAELIMIDDNMRINYPQGVIVNPSIYGAALPYKRNESSEYLLGKDYIILREEFRHKPEKQIRDKVNEVVISFGGIEQSDLISRIERCLKNKFDFNVRIIEPNKSQVNATEIRDIMLNADIFLTAGGQTTYELARLGVPSIGICCFENQRLNVEAWGKNGFIEYLGWDHDKELLLKLENAINTLMPYDERLKRSELGRGYVDGRGAHRIVSEVIEKKAEPERENA